MALQALVDKSDGVSDELSKACMKDGEKCMGDCIRPVLRVLRKLSDMSRHMVYTKESLVIL